MADKYKSALSFACSMKRKGQPLYECIRIAAGYYGVPFADIQKGMASRSGASQAGRKKPKETAVGKKCEMCGIQATHKATYRWGEYKQKHYLCEAHKNDQPDIYSPGEMRGSKRSLSKLGEVKS